MYLVAEMGSVATVTSCCVLRLLLCAACSPIMHGVWYTKDSACLMTYPAMSACCLLCAELHAAAAKPALRAEGVLQRISGQLLQQVPFTVLQAQVRGC